MMTSLDVLSTALSASANEGLSEIKARCTKVREALDAYESISLQCAERETLAKMLQAVSRPLPEGDLNKKLEAATDQLKQSVDALWAVVPAPPSSRVQLLPEPRPVAPPPLPRPRMGVRPEVSPIDVQAAEKLISEINTLAKSDLSHESELRLTPLLQALTAEARQLMQRLPPYHPMHRNLIHSFRTIANIKEERGIPAFIKGLGRESQGNWERIAISSRRRVESFDRDTETPLSTSTPTLVKKPLKIAAPIADTTENKFPVLSAKSKDYPLMIIGGIRIQEKIDYLRDTYGIESEWYETKKSTPRATSHIVDRVKMNKAPAALFLESFISHTTFDAIKAACNQVKLPFALADRGGQGGFELALMNLETRLKG